MSDTVLLVARKEAKVTTFHSFQFLIIFLLIKSTLRVNSRELRRVVEEAIENSDVKPNTIRFFRGAMFNMVRSSYYIFFSLSILVWGAFQLITTFT